MNDSICPSSGCQSGSLRGLEDPSPIPPQRAASVVKNAVKSSRTRGVKSVNLPPSGAARINGKWAVLAAGAQWQRRQNSNSKAAAAWRWQAAWQWRRQHKEDGSSAAAAGRCLRAHGHWVGRGTGKTNRKFGWIQLVSLKYQQIQKTAQITNTLQENDKCENILNLHRGAVIYQSKIICENKNVSYEAHLCPVIVKAQRSPNVQATLQIVDRHYEEFLSPTTLTLKPYTRCTWAGGTFLYCLRERFLVPIHTLHVSCKN
jgi:hypothetical protein